MKKTTALLLALCLTLALSACGTGELYLHDAPATQSPVVPAAPTETVPDEPAFDALSTLGTPVILNIDTVVETFDAPDESGRVILSYGYNDVRVYLESNPEAAAEINRVLARENEFFYTGTGEGDGINAMLEQAIDNYTLKAAAGLNSNLEFSSMRSVLVDRGDSRVLSLRYRVNSFTGGTHGSFAYRSYVFDMTNGDLLTLDDLAVDRAALEQVMLERMVELVQSDVRYQSVQDYLSNFRPDTTLTDALQALLREGSWMLNDEGFAVFSDLEELGIYAEGIFRFTLSYEELEGLIKEKYLPLERPDSGQLLILGLNDRNALNVPLIDKVTVSDDGAEFRLFAQGTVYNVTIDSVAYINDGFYQTDSHWYCSYLTNAGVQIKTGIPEGMPNLMVRCVDAEGQVHSYLVTQSGEDGSILLLQEEHVVAVG